MGVDHGKAQIALIFGMRLDLTRASITAQFLRRGRPVLAPTWPRTRR